MVSLRKIIIFSIILTLLIIPATLIIFFQDESTVGKAIATLVENQVAVESRIDDLVSKRGTQEQNIPFKYGVFSVVARHSEPSGIVCDDDYECAITSDSNKICHFTGPEWKRQKCYAIKIDRKFGTREQDTESLLLSKRNGKKFFAIVSSDGVIFEIGQEEMKEIAKIPGENIEAVAYDSEKEQFLFNDKGKSSNIFSFDEKTKKTDIAYQLPEGSIITDLEYTNTGYLLAVSDNNNRGSRKAKDDSFVYIIDTITKEIILEFTVPSKMSAQPEAISLSPDNKICIGEEQTASVFCTKEPINPKSAIRPLSSPESSTLKEKSIDNLISPIKKIISKQARVYLIFNYIIVLFSFLFTFFLIKLVIIASGSHLEYIYSKKISKYSYYMLIAIALFLIPILIISFGISGVSPSNSNEVLLNSNTPQEYKIAFIGDSGSNPNTKKVFQMIKDEKSDMVLHGGDFDYAENPDLWEGLINEYFGPEFPFIATAGNHDWTKIQGYDKYQDERFEKLNINCEGDPMAQATCTYKGLYIIMPGAGWNLPNAKNLLYGDEKDNIPDYKPAYEYAKEKLEEENSIWRICIWHKNQRNMQLGKGHTRNNGDETGWEVYDECRKGGAIIVTAHDHSYARSHLLSNIDSTPEIDSTSNTLEVEKGKSFVIVSGLGGQSNQKKETDLAANPWWGASPTNSDGVNFGALFCSFNHNGQPNKAHCYFKDINGKVWDEFNIVSKLNQLQ